MVRINYCMMFPSLEVETHNIWGLYTKSSMSWEDASGLYRKYLGRRFNYIAVAKRAMRCQNVETLLLTLLVSSEIPAVLFERCAAAKG